MPRQRACSQVSSASSSGRTLAVVKYAASACSKDAAAAEVEARGLISQSTMALNVKLLKRSDAKEFRDPAA